MGTDVRELRADNKTLRDKIDTVNNTLSAKIDGVNSNLSEKITKLSDAVARMHGTQKAMLWVIGGTGTFASILYTIGKALHWF